MVTRLDAIMDKLNELLERVAQLTAPHANPTPGASTPAGVP
jgi:hypothetical protein